MVKPADPCLAGKRGEFGRHRPGLHNTFTMILVDGIFTVCRACG